MKKLEACLEMNCTCDNYANMKDLVARPDEVKCSWEDLFWPGHDIDEGTTDVDRTSKSPWSERVCTEISLVWREGEIQKWVCTADSKHYEKNAPEPFILWRGIFVDHHKEERSETADGYECKEKVLDGADFLACEDVVVKWINAAHNEEADSTIIKLDKECPRFDAVSLVKMEHSRETEANYRCRHVENQRPSGNIGYGVVRVDLSS